MFGTSRSGGRLRQPHRPRTNNLATIRAALKDVGYLRITEGRRDHPSEDRLSALHTRFRAPQPVQTLTPRRSPHPRQRDHSTWCTHRLTPPLPRLGTTL
jgi:hypothetical protein